MNEDNKEPLEDNKEPLEDKQKEYNNTPVQLNDEILKKVNELVSNKMKDLFSDMKKVSNENIKLKEQTYENQIKSILNKDEVLDDRYFDFIKADNIDDVNNNIVKLKSLMNESITKVVQNKLNNSYIPESSENKDIIKKVLKNPYIMNLRD
ncbi:hypothetical protein ACED96_15480 [Clostridium thermobutyricum]